MVNQPSFAIFYESSPKICMDYISKKSAKCADFFHSNQQLFGLMFILSAQKLQKQLISNDIYPTVYRCPKLHWETNLSYQKRRRNNIRFQVHISSDFCDHHLPCPNSEKIKGKTESGLVLGSLPGPFQIRLRFNVN